MKKVKAKGTQGNWLVDVNGEKLPTAHMEFLYGMRYRRTSDAMVKKTGKYKSWVDALLEKKKVILTLDQWTGEPGAAGSKAKRIGYVGVYAVDDIVVVGNSHSFRLLELMAECT